MPFSNPSKIVDFDADSAVEVIKDEVQGTLYSAVEFDDRRFNILYVDDKTLSFYRDSDHMLEHFDRVHSYVYLDFTEIETFKESILPVSNRVDYITTCMDYLKVVRIYRGRQGLFIALERNESVQPLVDSVVENVDGFLSPSNTNKNKNEETDEDEEQLDRKNR
ncbi:MAG: hypothetical protein SXQ77_09980 [Halobacteria archaeon]|nr:hypothetical protein [Halobacteria archaeon]